VHLQNRGDKISPSISFDLTLKIILYYNIMHYGLTLEIFRHFHSLASVVHIAFLMRNSDTYYVP